MIKIRSQKGITLIALVITIIILIILAGISISILMGQNGLVTTAKKAAENYQLAANEEQTSITNLMEQLNSNTGGSSTPTTPTNNTAYTVGQEVTVGGEQFYVIENSDASQSTVTLITKYNINLEATAQVPDGSQNVSKIGCSFSSTNYWASVHATYYDENDSGWSPSPKTWSSDWTKPYLDLNKESEYGFTAGSGDAITKAKTYATVKGGTNGRLITYEELYHIRSEYGLDTIDKDNNLYYWLSSATADGNDGIWANYNGIQFYQNVYKDYYDYDDIGVRPVMTVDKSLVS